MNLFILALSSLLATEVLDFEMDPSEKKQTGVSKLNDKEKAELQCWIDTFYVRRLEPLAAKSPINKKAYIEENLHSGQYIHLSDHTYWNIRLTDTPISQGWITPVEILVSQSNDPDYPYKLTNSVTGSSVLARKVDKVPPSPIPPPAPAKPATPAPTKQPTQPKKS
jgi:hypothetical protein